MKKIKLQIFYIIITLFNFLHFLIFLKSMRRLFYIIARYKISSSASVQSVQFFAFGKLKIGDNTIVNKGCYLDNRRGITIGKNVVIAHDTKIYTLGHDINSVDFATKGASVVIEDNVILFSNVMIMPGVKIGNGAVVLPGSVVTKDVRSMEIVGGNPASFKDKRITIHDRSIRHYWFAM